MRFEVRALKATEGVVVLSLDAPDAAAALEQVSAQGLAALSARPRRRFRLSGNPFAARFPLVLFSQELVALSRAGLTLPETIEVMVEKETRPESRKVLTAIRDRLFEGQSFSQTLERLPQTFPPLYVATARASERTGDLAEALSRYIGYHERLDAVRRKIVSASIYPAVLLFVGMLVTLFLLGYVVPRFSMIYAESGRDLPLLSRLLLDWGQMINNHGTAAAGVLAVAALLAVAFFARLRSAVGKAVGRIPALGARLRVYHLARFYRTLAMLLRGGTPIVPALGLVGGVLPPGLGERLAQATGRIREGASISAAMTEAGLTTPVAARMLRVGESSGEMAEMMDRIAVFHDEELTRWVDWFTKLFEPLLMYMPIFELAGSLQ